MEESGKIVLEGYNIAVILFFEANNKINYFLPKGFPSKIRMARL